MLTWLAKKFERNRAQLQARLEDSLQAKVATPLPVESVDWRKRGNEFLNNEMLADAEACYRKGIFANSQDAVCFSNLGYVLGEQGRWEESERMLGKAIGLNPADFDAHYLLGNLALQRGEGLNAVASYRKALDVNREFDVCRRALCILLAQTGQIQDARKVLDQGPAFAADSADYHYFKGNLCLALGECSEAINCFHKAAQIMPKDTSILINLGVAQLRQRDIFSALQTYRSILGLEPENVQAHANIAAAYQLSGQLSLAIQSYRHALSLNPEYLDAHQNLLYALTYSPDLKPAEYLLEAQKYGAKVRARAKPYSQWLCPHLILDRSRPLRIGLISGDLHNHPVGWFLENILRNTTPAKLEFIAYSSSTIEDALSGRLKPIFSAWINVSSMPDEELAQKIHADKIDILIDLAGHTEHNRLPLFAWRPAPIQVSWLGYWASTGLTEIDYILVDKVSVPESERQCYAETPWYLPNTRLCFSAPTTKRALEVGALPAYRNGYVTFGSFQVINKVNDITLSAWSRILASTPSARLRLQSSSLSYPGGVQSILQRMSLANIDVERVDLFGGTERDEYLASYADVDMVLDTFPFPGGTTTVEALWMGVPTVTLSGNSMLARQGESLLRFAGLGDWVAADEQHYIALALEKAADLSKLNEVRMNLREHVLASPLFDSAEFAKNLTEALQGMAKKHAVGVLELSLN